MAGAIGKTMYWQLGQQDTESSFSCVSSICAEISVYSVVPNLEPYSPKTEEGKSRLEKIRNLLNWSYGYWFDGKSNSIKRTAPSAGGRYPTEISISLSIDGRWRTLYFDFSINRFFLHVDSNFNFETAGLLSLNQHDIVIGLYSLAWRSVQRYGVRGYRYCIVDAACVGSNISEVIHDSGGEIKTISKGILQSLEMELNFPKQLLLTSNIITDINQLQPIEWIQERIESPRRNALFVEEIPTINPKLERVFNLHRAVVRAPKALKSVDYVTVTRENRNRFLWAVNRRSSRGFDGRCVSRSAMLRFTNKFQEWLDTFLIVNEVTLSAIVFCKKKDNSKTESVQLLQANEISTTQPIPDALSMSQLSRKAFQNQKIVAECGSIIVLGVSNGCHRLPSNDALFELIWSVGCCLAESQRYLCEKNLACTIIGGFSDSILMKCLQLPNFFPYMALAIGNEEDTELKIDATPWLNHNRSQDIS